MLTAIIPTFYSMYVFLSYEKNIPVTLKEMLFFHFFNVYRNLEDFVKTRDLFPQEEAINSLRKISLLSGNILNSVKYAKVLNTGFDTDKFGIFLNKLNKNIPCYKKDINDAKHKIIIKRTRDFKNMTIAIDNGDINSLFKLVDKDYKLPEKNRIIDILLRLRVVSLRSIFKTGLSLIISLLICWSIINALNITPIINTIESALATFVFYFMIAGGIRRFVVDPIDELITKKVD